MADAAERAAIRLVVEGLLGQGRTDQRERAAALIRAEYAPLLKLADEMESWALDDHCCGEGCELCATVRRYREARDGKA